MEATMTMGSWDSPVEQVAMVSGETVSGFSMSTGTLAAITGLVTIGIISVGALAQRALDRSNGGSNRLIWAEGGTMLVRLFKSKEERAKLQAADIEHGMQITLNKTYGLTSKAAEQVVGAIEVSQEAAKAVGYSDEGFENQFLAILNKRAKAARQQPDAPAGGKVV